MTSLRRRYRSLNRVLQQKAPKSSGTRFGGSVGGKNLQKVVFPDSRVAAQDDGRC